MVTQLVTEKQHYGNREVVTLADPVNSAVIDSHGCRSIKLLLHYSSAAAAAAVVTLQHGDLADGSDMADMTGTGAATPNRELEDQPQANVAGDNIWRIIEIVPSKQYVRITFSGVAVGTVDVLSEVGNCRVMGHGADKLPTPDGVLHSSLACTIPTDCVA